MIDPPNLLPWAPQTVHHFTEIPPGGGATLSFLVNHLEYEVEDLIWHRGKRFYW